MGVRTVIGVLGIALVMAACGSDSVVPADGEDGFDRAAVEQAARDLLGRSADEIEEGRLTRIVRRGDEDFPATMDLVPGRLNVELDDDGTGTFVVTRIVAEVPDDVEPIVVE